MKFFNFKKKHDTNDTKPKIESPSLDYAELEKKAQLGKTMTFDESEALRRYRQKEVSNQVLRLLGLLTIITVVIFAVGTFLYPYSILNVFGTAKFWDCFGMISVRNGDEWVRIGQIYSIDSTLNLNDPITGEIIKLPAVPAFQPGSSAIINFYALGAWTIIPLATVGLFSIVIFAIYVLVYNIKDLVLVIKHLNTKTKDVVTDIANITKETVNEVKDKDKKPTTKKTKKKKVLVEDTSELNDDVSKKIEEIKAEISKSEKDEPSIIPVTVNTTELNKMDDSDLDKLLQQ